MVYAKTEETMGKNLKIVDDISTNFFNSILGQFQALLEGKDKIIFLPCASSKPIQISRSHCYMSPITRSFDEKTAVFIVSEPLILIPYYQISYPNYEYDPKDLGAIEKREFIKRLSQFMELIPKNIETYYIGGSHHYKILKQAGFNGKYYKPSNGLTSYKEKAIQMKEELYPNGCKTVKFVCKKPTNDLVEFKEVKIK